MTLRVLSLFAGIGGFDLGLERTGGFKTVAFCEIDPFCRRVLAKHWPEVPCYDDVRTLTAERLAADGIAVDVICGGFPCQDASVGNVVGLGTDGERTGLFRHIIKLADDIRPEFVLMENVANLLNRGFGNVLGALAQIGYDAEWSHISARDIGADHERNRVWLVAYPSGTGRQGLEPHDCIFERAEASLSEYGDQAFGTWRRLVRGERSLRSGDGLSVAMERRRLHGLGNAVVPQIPEMLARAILSGMAAE